MIILSMFIAVFIIIFVCFLVYLYFSIVVTNQIYKEIKQKEEHCNKTQ